MSCKASASRSSALSLVTAGKYEIWISVHLYDGMVLTRDCYVVSMNVVAVTERAESSAEEEEVETEAMGAEEEAVAEVATAEVAEATGVAEVTVAMAATTVATEVVEAMATAEDMEVATGVAWRTEEPLATVLQATSVPIRCPV